MSKIQHGNYSVHFSEQVELNLHQGAVTGKWADNTRWVCGMIERAQHFVMPDNARLVDVSEMPDYMPVLLRPPYPVTVIEYAVTLANDESDPHDGARSTRRIVLAFDAEEGEPPFPLALGPHTPAHGVCIIPIVYMDGPGLWAPPAAMFFVPYDQQVEAREITPVLAKRVGLKDGAVAKALSMDVAALSVEHFTNIKSRAEFDQAYNALLADGQYEIFAYQQLCMTLGCSNVSAGVSPASEKLNRSRTKSGKRRLFDYHVLTIPGSTESDGVAGGVGRSVRTHLRRGHIRRLQTGKIVWINATLVKGGATGFVGKSYSVKPQ